MLNFPFGPERDSLQESFFNEDDENETDQDQEKGSSRVSEVAEE